MDPHEALASTSARISCAVRCVWDSLGMELSHRIAMPLRDRIEEMKRTAEGIQTEFAKRSISSGLAGSQEVEAGVGSASDWKRYQHHGNQDRQFASIQQQVGARGQSSSRGKGELDPVHQGSAVGVLRPFEDKDTSQDDDEEDELSEEEQQSRFHQFKARLEKGRAASGVLESGGPLKGAGSIEQTQMEPTWHAPVTKEELGRATWTLLHTLAAQYPDKPSRKLQSDVKTFMNLLPSVYPCRICGEHFKEVIKSNPPQCNSRADLEQYMCRIHNVVNRSLDKPEFPCKRVVRRWGSVECDDNACAL